MIGVSSTDVAARMSVDGNSIEHVIEGVIKWRPGVTEMTAALGLHRGAYYRRIKNPNYPDAEELRRIAHAFDLDPVWLQKKFGLIAYIDDGNRYVAIADPAITAQHTGTLTPSAELPGLG